MVEGGESSCGLSFLRILMSGFSKKLPIPPAFVDRASCMEEKFSSGVAKLVNINGKYWHVDVYKEHKQGDMYFGGEGLLEFALANRLRIGYFLVFCYRGNMTFSISVFGKGGCLEKRPKKNFKKFHRDRNKTGGSSHGKRSASHWKNNIDQEEEGNPDINYHDHRDASVRRKPDINPEDDDKDASRVKMSNCSIKGGASFETTIKPSNLVTPYLGFPREFCVSNGLTDVSDIILMDPKDRPWHVSFYHRRIRSSLSKGWPEFARANRLRVGDKCIFLLGSQEINHDKVVIHVKILKK